jgi:alanine racemase
MKKDWLAFVHRIQCFTQSMNNRPNILTIHLDALVSNLQQIRSLLDTHIGIMAVVKADAYGHGLVPVARTLEKNPVHSLGVAHLYEAVTLRQSGIRLPIAILCGIHSVLEAEAAVENDLLPVVFDPQIVEALAREAGRRGKTAKVYIKVDTGMGRLGIPHQDLAPFLEKALSLENLDIAGLTSHLSSADEPHEEYTRFQISNFRHAVEAGRSMGLMLPENNLANSAGAMSYPDAWFELVRPGIMLYGGLPSPDYDSRLTLQPVMHFSGRVLQVRAFPDSTPVSYGRTYSTHGTRRIAVTSAGYGDGLPRSLSNRGHVLIHGALVPIVGAVCMNQTLCDVTGVEGVRAWDEVIFLGTQGEKTITGDDIARHAQTISYEVFCSIGQRNIKEYV